MQFKIINKTKEINLVSSAEVASGFFLRLLGLMFRQKLGPDQALIFYQAPSIHTFFMRFPIDIIFLNRQMAVKRIVYSLPPWRAVFCQGAYITIELPAGKAIQTNLSLGDRIGLAT